LLRLTPYENEAYIAETRSRITHSGITHSGITHSRINNARIRLYLVAVYLALKVWVRGESCSPVELTYALHCLFYVANTHQNKSCWPNLPTIPPQELICSGFSPIVSDLIRFC